jgi:hypothetical protein
MWLCVKSLRLSLFFLKTKRLNSPIIHCLYPTHGCKRFRGLTCFPRSSFTSSIEQRLALAGHANLPLVRTSIPSLALWSSGARNP